MKIFLLQVFFLDYGHPGKAKFKDLKKYLGKFSYMPIQAVKMRFANIKALYDDDKFYKTNACSTLNDLCSELLVARIFCHDSNGDIYVHLFNTQGYDIGDLMIKQNLAAPRDDLVVTSKENPYFPG